MLFHKFNIGFKNVLFVTPSTLDEYACRACSMVWRMVLRNIPTVHESPLAGTSKHLIGETTAPSHLFLKVEAFKATLGLSIISDLDLVVTLLKKLAKHNDGFPKHNREDARMWLPGSVMGMQRNLSTVVDADAVVIHKDYWSLIFGKKQMPVSCCCAFIK